MVWNWHFWINSQDINSHISSLLFQAENAYAAFAFAAFAAPAWQTPPLQAPPRQEKGGGEYWPAHLQWGWAERDAQPGPAAVHHAHPAAEKTRQEEVHVLPRLHEGVHAGPPTLHTNLKEIQYQAGSLWGHHRRSDCGHYEYPSGYVLYYF